MRAAANPLEGDWTGGVEVGGNGCLAPVRLAPCAVGDDDPQRPSPPVTFLPTTVRQIVECSTLGRTPVDEYANRAADVTTDYAMALELFDGAATSNPSLSVDAEVVGEISGLGDADDTVEAAIACLEANAASALSGRVALIHVPQGVSIHLPGSVRQGGDGILRTPAGNIVVVDPGYSGTSLYATGEVWAASQTIQTRTFTDRSDNTDQAWADRLVLALFDPCFLVEVTTDLVVCEPPSPE